MNQPFRALTIKYNGISDRIVTAISITPVFDPNEYPNEIPFIPYETNALWDTGATKSVITSATVKKLNLLPIGSVKVNHAGGVSQSNTYIINIILPGRVCVAGVIVSEANIIDNFGAIIGMDIIAKGDFSITNVNNSTWMSYRVPSIQTIDYVEESKKIKFAGIGRNDPCPCGKKDSNGKFIKFKFCHGKQK